LTYWAQVRTLRFEVPPAEVWSSWNLFSVSLKPTRASARTHASADTHLHLCNGHSVCPPARMAVCKTE
jgi:hypothetical protein